MTDRADWYVDQKIVCINDDFDPKWRDIATPRVNSIYMIREIVLFQYGDTAGPVISFRLREIIQNPERWIGPADLIQIGEIPFPAHRFRPVVEPEADISVFTAILARINKREAVDA